MPVLHPVHTCGPAFQIEDNRNQWKCMVVYLSGTANVFAGQVSDMSFMPGSYWLNRGFICRIVHSRSYLMMPELWPG
jgi:hypothetical protein